jgi:hypothetical protein
MVRSRDGHKPGNGLSPPANERKTFLFKAIVALHKRKDLHIPLKSTIIFA